VAEEAGSTRLTADVILGDLLIRAEATGNVEPVREVEVKSKASGEILRLHIDVGDEVSRGALLAEIDPRDVRNNYNQVQADLEVARARLEISDAQLERSSQLLAAEVITQQEHENSRIEYANSRASLVRAETNYELAELQMQDVSITAPMNGTVIQKNVEEGAVIQSASQNVSGGTTLFLMANLGEMQVRTLVDETDMGMLEPGMAAAVIVEAFPERTFQGMIEKIEPQAVVEQNVTMFPVIVSIDNRSGLLKPGMNAEVEIFIDEEFDVLLVPNNAIVNTEDVGPAAMALGLDIETLDLTAFNQVGRARGGFGGQRPSAAAARGGSSPQAGGQPGGSGRGGGQFDPETMAQMQALRAQVQSGEITQQEARERMQALGGGLGGFERRAFGSSTAGEVPERETRPAAVFVIGPDGEPEPQLIQMGLGDWDNTSVVSGLEEGDVLAIVGAAQLQAQQEEFMNRMRDRMGGGSPFGGGGMRGPPPGMGRGR
ncbi:uncharacterized protein METZ01_LOCUS137224, partial [marine metagenome]